MAVLLIDRGNSFVKWQLSHAGEVRARGISSNDQDLAKVFAEVEMRSSSSVIVASVASESFNDELNQWAKQAGLPQPVFVHSQAKACGVKNGYIDPEQLGVDRWLAVIAAHSNYQGLVCIVDCGTAFTIDFVNRQGEHLGGFILPGMGLMKGSLLKSTSRIDAAIANSQTLLGTSTSQAVDLAPAQALAAFIEQKISEISTDQGEKAVLVLTGGGVGELEAALHMEYHVEPELVFKGLEMYALENT